MRTRIFAHQRDGFRSRILSYGRREWGWGVGQGDTTEQMLVNMSRARRYCCCDSSARLEWAAGETPRFRCPRARATNVKYPPVGRFPNLPGNAHKSRTIPVRRRKPREGVDYCTRFCFSRPFSYRKHRTGDGDGSL